MIAGSLSKRLILSVLVSLMAPPIAVANAQSAPNSRLAVDRAASAPYQLDEAVSKGMVYLEGRHNRGETFELITHLPEINPGIVQGFGYFWGGPTQSGLDYVAETAARIRQQLPKALMSASLSESVAPNYSETLHCGGALGDRRFTVDQLTSHRAQSKTAIWLDMSKPEASSFYECAGQIYIDMGITVIGFEAPTLVLRNSTNRASAERAFADVIARLRAYGAKKSLPIYFVGDPDLERSAHMDLVIVPARLYHTTLASALKYQNKIPRTGIGIGYSYALSPLIVKDTVASVPASTKVFFTIDNWDPTQDDLRRMMELDADNRRFLIVQSARNARRGGAFFEPPLDYCPGCTPRNVVVDSCEIKSDNTTEYNALKCGDISTVKQALDLQK